MVFARFHHNWDFHFFDIDFNSKSFLQHFLHVGLRKVVVDEH